MRRNLLLILLGFVVGVFFYSFHNFGGMPSFWELLLNGALGVGISFAFHFCNLFLNKTIRWKKQTGLRLLSGIILHMILGYGIILLGLKGYELLYDGYNFFSNDNNTILVEMAVLLFCTVLIYNIIYMLFYSYRLYAVGQVREVRFRRKQTELQLKALKSQLSPHFLFNSLNTLSSLFQKDVYKAELFIRSLAKSYQYTLKAYQDMLVTVDEELIFVESYCYLVRTRFGDHLKLELELSDDERKSKIPPLTLQMLVENAVKHNIVDKEHPLTVSIKPNKDFLDVTNNKTKKRPETKSLKIGLKNIISRYNLLVSKTVKVIDAADFTVKLPIIK